jgi:hypothetical protein
MMSFIPLNSLTPHDPRCTAFNTCPKILFHYTSIKTLALILSTKTIRFNRLDKVQDPREAVTADFSDAQTLVFASCWTSQSTESLPLWDLYTKCKGVRIEMPTLMFKGRHNNHKVTTNDIHYEIMGGDYEIVRRGKQYTGLSGSTVMGPTKIRYFKDPKDLEIICIKNLPEHPFYDVRELGTRKHAHWQFEEEVRFRLLATFGYSREKDHALSPEDLKASPIFTEFVDAGIDDSALNEARIVLGPKTSSEDHNIVKSLCEKHAAPVSGRISKSSIELR